MCNKIDVSLTSVCAEVPLVSCCCAYFNEYFFLLTFIYTNTVQTRKAPLKKTKRREATIAATILPSIVWSSGDGIGLHDSEAVEFIPNDVSAGSVEKANTTCTLHTYTHKPLHLYT